MKFEREFELKKLRDRIKEEIKRRKEREEKARRRVNLKYHHT